MPTLFDYAAFRLAQRYPYILAYFIVFVKYPPPTTFTFLLIRRHIIRLFIYYPSKNTLSGAFVSTIFLAFEFALLFSRLPS